MLAHLEGNDAPVLTKHARTVVSLTEPSTSTVAEPSTSKVAEPSTSTRDPSGLNTSLHAGRSGVLHGDDLEVKLILQT